MFVDCFSNYDQISYGSSTRKFRFQKIQNKSRTFKNPSEQPLFEDKFPVTHNLYNNEVCTRSPIDLTSFSWILKQPKSRFQPLSNPSLHSHICLETTVLVLFRNTSEIPKPTKMDEQKNMYELFVQTSSDSLTRILFPRLFVHQKLFNKQSLFSNTPLSRETLAGKRSIEQTKTPFYLETRPFIQKQPTKYFTVNLLKNQFSLIDIQDTLFESTNNYLILTNKQKKNIIRVNSTVTSLKFHHTYLSNFNRRLSRKSLTLITQLRKLDKEKYDYFRNKTSYLLLSYFNINSQSEFVSRIPLKKRNFVNCFKQFGNIKKYRFGLASSSINTLVTNFFFTQLQLKLRKSSAFFKISQMSLLGRSSRFAPSNLGTKKQIHNKDLVYKQLFKQLKTQTRFEINQTSSNLEPLLPQPVRELQPHFLFPLLHNKNLVLDTQPWFIYGFYQYTQVEHLDLLKTSQNANLRSFSKLPLVLYNQTVQPGAYFMSRKPLNFAPLQIAFRLPIVKQSYSIQTEKILDFEWRTESFVRRKLNTLQHKTISKLSNRQSGLNLADRSDRPIEKYALPGIFSLGIRKTFDTNVFLGHSTTLIGKTKSSYILKTETIEPGTGDNIIPLAKTACLSPFEGELIASKQTPTRSQLLFLTKKDLISFSLCDTTPSNKEAFLRADDLRVRSSEGSTSHSTRNPLVPAPEPAPILLHYKKQTNVGAFVKYGDFLSASLVSRDTGYIIHSSQTKMTLRRSQFIAASNKAILHVKTNDWVEKNTALITLPFQRLKAGDIVQGIPKIEQYFEARKSKAGRFYRDSIPNLMNVIFNHYLLRFRLIPFGTTIAVKKTIIKIQQILLNGIQRVYRTQGVSIADKHIEIIVRQMTSKVRVLNPGLTSFVPGELVDAQLMLQLNLYLEEEVFFEPIVLGITQASLEVDSFISASSFQQTARVLCDAALVRKRDYLRGLKENVILGNLMPAGTGHRFL